MSAVLAPVFGAAYQSYYINNGTLAFNSGGMLYSYLAGSTTAQATYTDSTQAVQNANPIVLNASGRPSNEVWQTNGVAYKYILTDPNNNVLGTWDFLPGINSSNVTSSEWVAGLTATYVSANSFTVLGNNVATYQISRRIQYSVTSGTYYGTIVGASFSSISGLTTVTFTADSTGIDSSLTTVNYGFLNATNPSVPNVFVPILNPTFQGIVTIPAGAVIAGYAQLAGATFTGSIAGPQPPANDSSTLLATTAFVTAQGLVSTLPGQGGQSGQWIQTVSGAAQWSNAFRKYETERVVRRGRQLTFS